MPLYVCVYVCVCDDGNDAEQIMLRLVCYYLYTDAFGRTAIDVAREAKQEDCLRFFQCIHSSDPRAFVPMTCNLTPLSPAFFDKVSDCTYSVRPQLSSALTH